MDNKELTDNVDNVDIIENSDVNADNSDVIENLDEKSEFNEEVKKSEDLELDETFEIDDDDDDEFEIDNDDEFEIEEIEDDEEKEEDEETRRARERLEILKRKEISNSEYNKIIGSNIRFERQKRDLTIEELSEILTIAPGFLGLIERGQRGTSIKNLCRISEFFSITLDQLITKPAGTLIRSEKEVLAEKTKEAILRTKLSTAVSLINGLTSTELDFVISIIKNVRKLTKTIVLTPDVEDDSSSDVDLEFELDEEDL